LHSTDLITVVMFLVAAALLAAAFQAASRANTSRGLKTALLLLILFLGAVMTWNVSTSFNQ
jgi:uncharacterized membrane protein